MRRRIKGVESDNETLQKDLTRIQEERNWIKGFADNVKNPAHSKGNLYFFLINSTGDVLSPDHLSNVENFLKFYQRQLSDIDSRLSEVTNKINGTAVFHDDLPYQTIRKLLLTFVPNLVFTLKRTLKRLTKLSLKLMPPNLLWYENA